MKKTLGFGFWAILALLIPAVASAQTISVTSCPSTVAPGETVNVTWSISGGTGSVTHNHVHYGYSSSTVNQYYTAHTYSTPYKVGFAAPASGTIYLKVDSIKGGKAFQSAVYTVRVVMPTVATPTFSPAAPQTFTNTISVSISCATSGATIRYTTSGSDPTASSTVYSGSLTLSSTTTLKAKAFKSGMTDSAVASGTYTKLAVVATPTFSPAPPQTFTSTISVSISSATSGATIRYTTNGSDPTSSSSVYAGSLTLSATTTLKAKAFKSGMTDSAVASGTYTKVPPPTVATPTFSPAAPQTFASTISVSISCATSGATIRYTTNGSDPTSSSSAYSSALTLSATTTLKAKAFKSGMTDSAVATGVYTKSAPAGDAYEVDDTPAQAKTITSGQTQNRSIHAAGNVDWVKFTLAQTSAVVIDTNGASGDTEMWLYGPNSSTSLASAPNYSDDAHGTWAKIDHTSSPLPPGDYYIKITEYGNDGTIPAYTLSLTVTPVVQQVATPTFSPAAPQTFASTISVSISCATSGATIRYTTNGSDPTSSSSAYSSALTLSATTTLKAKAFKSGMTDSAVATGVYTKSAPAGDAYEVDDTPGQAKTISNGQTQNRSIHAAGNVDWVRFTLTQTSAVVIDTNGASGDTEMWLYGPNSSTSLAAAPNYSDDAHGTWAKIDHASSPLPPGDYYIKITEYGNNGTIPAYTLSLTVTPVQQPSITVNDPHGDPTSNTPGDGAGQIGNSEIVFSSASPGVLTVVCRFTVSAGNVSNINDKVRACISGVGSSSLQWQTLAGASSNWGGTTSGQPTGAHATMGKAVYNSSTGKFEVKAVFTGLPTNNADWGRKTVWAQVVDGSSVVASATQQVEVFFPLLASGSPSTVSPSIYSAPATNNPANNRTANWYYFWKQGAVAGLSDCTYKPDQPSGSGVTFGGFDGWKIWFIYGGAIEIYAPAGLNNKDELVFTKTAGTPGNTGFVRGSWVYGRGNLSELRGLHAARNTVVHEKKHESNFQRIASSPWPWPDLDKDDDGCPDELEPSMGMIVGGSSGQWRDTYTFANYNSVYASYGDNEVMARYVAGQGRFTTEQLRPELGSATQDFAAPGKQYGTNPQ